MRAERRGEARKRIADEVGPGRAIGLKMAAPIGQPGDEGLVARKGQKRQMPVANFVEPGAGNVLCGRGAERQHIRLESRVRECGSHIFGQRGDHLSRNRLNSGAVGQVGERHADGVTAVDMADGARVYAQGVQTLEHLGRIVATDHGQHPGFHPAYRGAERGPERIAPGLADDPAPIRLEDRVDAERTCDRKFPSRRHYDLPAPSGVASCGATPTHARGKARQCSLFNNKPSPMWIAGRIARRSDIIAPLGRQAPICGAGRPGVPARPTPNFADRS